MAAQESADFVPVPFRLETTEAARQLPCLQNMIVRSLMHDIDYLGEPVEDEVLDQLFLQGEPYLEKIGEIVKPRGFHGSIVSAAIIVSTISPEEVNTLRFQGKSAFRYGMRMDIHATETSSSARKQAGSFMASLLYVTTTRKEPNSTDLPTDLLSAQAVLPVKRKVISKPEWGDGSAFDLHLQGLARLKGPDIAGSRTSGGKVRRLPKHR